LAVLLAPPVVTGYSFDQSPDLSDAEERERLSPSAIKAFLNISRKWGLSEAQARGLLGGIASSTFHAWKTQPRGKKLDQDILTRISLVIGIYKALHIYFGDPWADRWVGLANRSSLFAGRPPIEYMLRQGQPGMMQVRRMLDSWRGGR
jgi:Antitoxin Xre-like helix-turn-helix domain/Antitoxin Xre/MbcA/ParS C-terminal toxin-binding domain